MRKKNAHTPFNTSELATNTPNTLLPECFFGTRSKNIAFIRGRYPPLSYHILSVDTEKNFFLRKGSTVHKPRKNGLKKKNGISLEM
jgi:hypothetical protein